MTESNSVSVFIVEPRVTHQQCRLLCSTTRKVKDEKLASGSESPFSRRKEGKMLATPVELPQNMYPLSNQAFREKSGLQPREKWRQRPHRTNTPTCLSNCSFLQLQTTSCCPQSNAELVLTVETDLHTSTENQRNQRDLPQEPSFVIRREWQPQNGRTGQRGR